ncbi:MAG: hypothetical protein ABIJ97_17030 [Bacteroidota bacterium]
MKSLIIIFLSFTLFIIINICSAQAPQGIKYQAVVRDGQGNLITNDEISLRLSLVSNLTSYNIEYQETHHVTTNNFGLINIVIGQGNIISGDFNQILWEKNNMFLKVELDLDNIENYVELGISEILSVPYALSSKKSEYSNYADTAYFTLNESMSNDKQIRFEFGPSNTYGLTTTDGQIIDKPSQTIIKFNKDNYSNIESIVFGASIYSSSSSSNCIVELWDITNNSIIANSSLNTSNINETYIESQNILLNIPNGEITLAVKIKSDTENSGAWISKAYLFVNRVN